MTKKRKNPLSFPGKMRIFYTENKQTGQLIFSFLVTLTKKRKMEWTGLCSPTVSVLKVNLFIHINYLLDTWSFLVTIIFNAKLSPANCGRVFVKVVVGIAVVVKGLFFCLTRILTRPPLSELGLRLRLLMTSFWVSIASVAVVVVDVVDLKKKC